MDKDVMAKGIVTDGVSVRTFQEAVATNIGGSVTLSDANGTMKIPLIFIAGIITNPKRASMIKALTGIEWIKKNE